MSGPIYRQLLRARTNGPGFLWLIDPDKIDPQNSDPRWQEAHNYGVTAILVGTSQKCETPFDRHVARIRHHAKLPLILFPGSATQISAYVDAVLFLMLLSGRNPDYLVGEQVKGTPAVRDYGIEPIPTGYLLIDTGSETSSGKAGLLRCRKTTAMRSVIMPSARSTWASRLCISRPGRGRADRLRRT